MLEWFQVPLTSIVFLSMEVNGTQNSLVTNTLQNILYCRRTSYGTTRRELNDEPAIHSHSICLISNWVTWRERRTEARDRSTDGQSTAVLLAEGWMSCQWDTALNWLGYWQVILMNQVALKERGRINCRSCRHMHNCLKDGLNLQFWKRPKKLMNEEISVCNSFEELIKPIFFAQRLYDESSINFMCLRCIHFRSSWAAVYINYNVCYKIGLL